MDYKRVLLKLSGESLGGNDGVGIDEQRLADYAAEIAAIVSEGKQVSIVPRPRAPVLLTSRPMKPHRQPAAKTNRAGPADILVLSVFPLDIFLHSL